MEPNLNPSTNLIAHYKKLQEGKLVKINERNTIKLVPLEKITHLECDDYLTTLHTTEGKHSHTKCLKEYEDTYKQLGLLRISRCTLVNLVFISSIGACKCKMAWLDNQVELVVSRRNMKNLRDLVKIG